MKSEPAKTFTLIPELATGTGTLSSDGRVSSYIVGGLPLGKQAAIAQRDHAWRIWHVGDGSPDEWHGRYATAEEALAALQAEWGENTN